jgi:hypothetical protein
MSRYILISCHIQCPKSQYRYKVTKSFREYNDLPQKYTLFKRGTHKDIPFYLNNSPFTILSASEKLFATITFAFLSFTMQRCQTFVLFLGDVYEEGLEVLKNVF